MELGGGSPRPLLLTGAKKSHLWCLISFQLPMGFHNFVVINKIHPLKKMVGGCLSNRVNVVSGVPQGSVLGPLLFLLYTSEFFPILEYKLIGYADDSPLIGVVPSPGIRVTVAEFLSRDDMKVIEWCDMKLYASKTKTMIISRSRTMHPQSPALTFGGTMLEETCYIGSDI